MKYMRIWNNCGFFQLSVTFFKRSMTFLFAICPMQFENMTKYKILTTVLCARYIYRRYQGSKNKNRNKTNYGLCLQESTMYEQERQPFAMHFDAPMTEEMLRWLWKCLLDHATAHYCFFFFFFNMGVIVNIFALSFF